MSNDFIYRVEYFYLIQHIDSGKFYAGSKYSFDAHPDQLWNINHKGIGKPYFTNSKYVKEIIKKEGIESFKVVFISRRPNNDAREFESVFLKSINAAKDNLWINKHNGSNNFISTPESILKVGMALKNKPKSKEHRGKLSLANKGKKQSKETIEKRTSKTKGKTRTDEFKLKISKISSNNKYVKGKIWINNGVETKMINPSDNIPEGFILGRGTSCNKGKIWINNGIKSKMISPSDIIPEGFSLGFLIPSFKSSNCSTN